MSEPDQPEQGDQGSPRVTMPMLESLEPVSHLSSVRTKSSSPKSPISNSQTSAMAASPMDLLKNPFLLPAPLLALNPNLYAAQLAQLQAAQLLFAKQQSEQLTGGDKNGLSLADSRKRSIEEDSPLDLGSKAAKYPRSSSPIDGRREPNSESPLDLSGNKSPDVKRDISSFNPLLPPNLLSFFNQMQQQQQHQQKSQPSPDLMSMASLMGFSPPGSAPAPTSPPSRGSPWQSQWISKTSESTRIEDVFKCVWCKESYQTLEALTTHMKEAKHHTMPYPLASSVPMMRPGQQNRVSSPSPIRTSVSMSSPMSSMSTSPKPAPARDILKEQLPIPRKLVRGQDVWIGRADQQTKDILKCMSCGESFRSLELLTKHMQETQHYKKVISHDQISSWKYPETQQQPNKNHVNSVLSCKVCDKGFSSLKDLSDHMVKANHYTVDAANKMPRNAPQGPPPSNIAKDRKKALPVKKLLELERARHEVMGGASGANKSVSNARDIMESGKLACERCEEKIPLDFYMAHIQQCVGRPRIANNPVVVKTEPEIITGLKSSENEKKSEAGSSSASSSHSSILGSLEQLVKGNFHGSPQKRHSAMSSPPTSVSSSKFSIQNIFQKEPPSSPCSSVVSPSSSRPSSHHSLEKMSTSPNGQTLDKPNGKEKEDSDADTICNVDIEDEKSVKEDSMNGESNLDDKKVEPQESDEEVESDRRDPDSISPPPLVAKLSLASDDMEKKSDSPLAALQMLCDTQKKTPKTPKLTENDASDPGSMLAFSWACNQAMSSDSVIKCPFCDTPFISKGAYRHHLSKMHFKETGGGGGSGTTPVPATVRTPSPDSKEDQTLQSKYHKYAQLAKQLSCNQK